LNREDHGCKSVDEAFKYVLAEGKRLRIPRLLSRGSSY